MTDDGLSLGDSRIPHSSRLQRIGIYSPLRSERDPNDVPETQSVALMAIVNAGRIKQSLYEFEKGAVGRTPYESDVELDTVGNSEILDLVKSVWRR
jgi:hypothetical protein